MATALAIASFAWSILSSVVAATFKAIPWTNPVTWCVLSFMGGCAFYPTVLAKPAVSPVINPSPVTPRKPILPWRASEAGAAERPHDQQHVPTPDPISTPDAPPQPADETRPRSSELIDQLNADLNARMNFNPNPKPVGSKAPATSCGPRGCPPSAGGGGSGGLFRRGLFRRR